MIGNSIYKANPYDHPYYGHQIFVADKSIKWEEYSLHFDGDILDYPIDTLLSVLNSDYSKLIANARQLVCKYLASERVDMSDVLDFEGVLSELHKYFITKFRCTDPSRMIIPAHKLFLEQVLFEIVNKYISDPSIDEKMIETDIKNFILPIFSRLHGGNDDLNKIVSIEQFKKLILRRIKNNEALPDLLGQIEKHLDAAQAFLLIYSRSLNQNRSFKPQALEIYLNYIGGDMRAVLEKTTPLILTNTFDNDLMDLIVFTISNNPSDEDMFVLKEKTLKKTDQNDIKLVDTYEIECFEQLLYLYLRIIILNDIPVKMCDVCNTWFIPKRNNIAFCEEHRKNGSNLKNKLKKKTDSISSYVNKINRLLSEFRSEGNEYYNDRKSLEDEWDDWISANEDCLKLYFREDHYDSTKIVNELESLYKEFNEKYNNWKKEHDKSVK